MNKKKKITLSIIATMLFALTLTGGLLLKQKQELLTKIISEIEAKQKILAETFK